MSERATQPGYRPMRICENCCHTFRQGESDASDETYRFGSSEYKATDLFCSLDCERDDAEERRVGRIEAAREYEMWGTDYDSWYR